MPNAEARAAFSEAQNLAARMRRMHEQEESLVRVLKSSAGDEANERISAELAGVRRDWAGLFKEYSNAMQRYTLAVEMSRKGH